MKLVVKKLIFFLLLFTGFIILGNVKSNASGNLFLNDLNFDVNVNIDGSMDVTETWDIDIEDTNTLFKTFKTDSTKYSDISNVKVVDITNGINRPFRKINTIMYHVTENCYYGKINSDGNFEIAWGVGMDNSSGDRKYQITYTVEDAIAKYNDYAELYWQFVGDDFEVNARNISGTITLPQSAVSKDEIKVWGHTEGLNGEIYVTDLDTIQFNLKGFNSGRYVEIRTLFPTEMIVSSARTKNIDILDSVIEEETVWANEANAKRARRDIINIVIIVGIYSIALLVSILCIRKAIKIYNEQKGNKAYVPEQELKYFRELPRQDATPAQALKIYKELHVGFPSNDLGKVVSATLLDLNLKKYINFKVEKEKRKEKIIINILNANANESDLPEDEKAILNFLIGACEKDSNQITVKEFKKYISRAAQTNILKEFKTRVDMYTKDELVNLGLYDKDQERIAKKHTSAIGEFMITLFFAIFITSIIISEINTIFIGAIAIVVISTIISMIIVEKAKKKVNVYTQKGVDEREKWKGLKKYMEDFSMLDEKEVPDIALWEHFLVYATVFGIAEKVLKQLKVVYPDLEQNLDVNTYTYMHIMLHTNFSSSFSNAISTSMSSAYSSSTGGGGGFSGGGGGGRRTAEVVAEDNHYLIK